MLSFQVCGVLEGSGFSRWVDLWFACCLLLVFKWNLAFGSSDSMASVLSGNIFGQWLSVGSGVAACTTVPTTYQVLVVLTWWEVLSTSAKCPHRRPRRESFVDVGWLGLHTHFLP